MNKKLPAIIGLLAIALTSNAQLQSGRKDIEKLCGCFDVEFKYAETFSPDPNYKFHKSDFSQALELALPIEQSDKKVVIQHLLVMGDSLIIKHWREEWTYEAPFILKYEGDKKWTKQELKGEQVKGKWTQTVWEVDDAPRYQGASDWVTTDNKTFWQSAVNAPLPRREYTTRNDYNIMKRGSRIIITDSGYVHEQDNDKLIRTGDTYKLVAQEKGYNTYVRAKDIDCAAGKAWWEKNGAFWNKVRAEWEGVLKTQSVINLKSKVDNKGLNDYLTEVWKQWNTKAITLDEAGAKTKKLLLQFTGGNDVATN
ncbi:DUF6607 family protein [Chitinophagaceae bacterium LWZ2-11]